MSYRLTFLPQATALTQRRTALTSPAILFVLGIAGGVGCTSGDRTLGIESNATAANLAAAVATVTVSPTSATLAPGATRQFSVILRDAAGNRLSLTGRTVTWKSSNTLVATVSSTGLVKALVLGSAVITATVEGKSGTSKVTVKNILSWIWSNGFETSLGGMNVTAATHPGGSVTRVKALPHKGLYSLKFKTPNRTKSRATAFKAFSGFPTNIHIADVWFRIPTGQSSNLQLEVTLEAWDGTQAHLPAVNWIRQDAVNALGWRRYVNGNWQYVPGGKGKGLSENVWHHLVLEVDYAKRVYRKLTIDKTVFPLTDLPYDVNARTAAPRRQMTILVWTSAPIARTLHVDDVRMGILR